MRLAPLGVAAIVVASASAAWALDASVLGCDDFEFVEALTDEGYPDLARSLLLVVEQTGGADEPTWFRRTRLDWAHDDARRIDDPVLRRDALVAVLYGSQRFVEQFRDEPAAVRVCDAVSDLCVDLGESIVVALRQSKDDSTVEALRTEGDSVLARAEEWISWRIDELKARASESDEVERTRLSCRGFGHAQLLYVHALIFQPGSDRRLALCTRAEEGFETLLLGVDVEGEATWRDYYAVLYSGLCLNEIGKRKEAIESFDKVIALRESYGDADATTGVYPIPAEARDVVELVCYAVLQKMFVLRDLESLDAVVAAGRDYLATTPRPFDAGPSMLLARTVADAQLATGDAQGAAETARRMVLEDPDGVGGRWGRELAERTAK